jgi:S-adenosyl-L-methionine hydrolase (adenosine-forming)
MQIITLTTDYGYQDHYAAVLKAEILEKLPSANLFELTHGVSPFNISHAELVVRQAWQHFEHGTVHLVCVREYYAEQPEWIYGSMRGHHFIAPNHGLLPLIAQGGEMICRKINTNDRAVPVFVVQALVEGIDPAFWSTAELELQHAINLRPVVTTERLRGTVIYADHYGNIITNIERSALEAWLDSRIFHIVLKRNEPLHGILNHYGEVAPGEPLAYWTASGMLAIGVHNGHAQSLLNFEPNDVVDIIVQSKS